MEINCLKIATEILEKLKEEFFNYLQLGKQIFVVDLLASENKESLKYAEIKKAIANQLGINFSIVFFHSQDELKKLIVDLNNDKNINGYILQFPIPKSFNIYEIIRLIDYKKDIDGISVNSILSSYLNYPNPKILLPCTASAILKVLDNLQVDLCGKKVVIINRSLIIGKPLFHCLMNKNATVTMCHEKTKNLKKICQDANVIISAIGKPNFFDQEYVNSDSIIIDCGINYVGNKVVGDFDMFKISDVVKYYTPVPNGIGKLTTTLFFENLLKLIKKKF